MNQEAENNGNANQAPPQNNVEEGAAALQNNGQNDNQQAPPALAQPPEEDIAVAAAIPYEASISAKSEKRDSARLADDSVNVALSQDSTVTVKTKTFGTFEGFLHAPIGEEADESSDQN